MPKGKFIIVANHRSYSDIPILMTLGDFAMLSKAEVANYPIFGLAAKAVGTLFVHRDSAKSRADALLAIADRVKSGTSVFIFPEGTTLPVGNPVEFRRGVFTLAAENDCQILPIAIEYKHKGDAWLGDDGLYAHAARSFGKLTTPVKIKIGTPIFVKDGVALCNLAEKTINDALNEISFQPKVAV